VEEALLLESAATAAFAFELPPLVPSVPGPPLPKVPFAPLVPAAPLSLTVAALMVESDTAPATTIARRMRRADRASNFKNDRVASIGCFVFISSRFLTLVYVNVPVSVPIYRAFNQDSPHYFRNCREQMAAATSSAAHCRR
jgi:hypothetical protein